MSFSRMTLIILAVAFSCVAVFASQASAELFPDGFEVHEGYALGDIQGQNGWSYFGNSFTDGEVVHNPAGSPAQLGARSLLLSTRTPELNGVTSGVMSTPAANPHGIPGSRVGGVGGAGPFAGGNTYEGDFWFRTFASDAASSGIADGSFFFQVNLASDLDRFGRVALMERTGTTYSVRTDAYKAYDVVAPYDGDIITDELVAGDLEFGEWYRLHTKTEFQPTTFAVDTFTNGDVMSIEIFDEAGASLGSITDSSSWMAAWVATPDGFNDANAGHYAINRLNFLNRGAGIPNETAIMYIDNVPEPGSALLLALGAVSLLRFRRKR